MVFVSGNGNGNGPSDARAQEPVQEPETQRGRKRPCRVPQSRAVGLSPSAQTSGELAETSGAAGNNTSSPAGNIMMYGLRNNFTLSCRFPHPSSVLHEATLERA